MDLVENVDAVRFLRVAVVAHRLVHQVLAVAVPVALALVLVLYLPVVQVHQVHLVHRLVLGYPRPVQAVAAEVTGHPEIVLLHVSGLGMGILVILMILRYGYTRATLQNLQHARYLRGK